MYLVIPLWLLPCAFVQHGRLAGTEKTGTAPGLQTGPALLASYQCSDTWPPGALRGSDLPLNGEGLCKGSDCGKVRLLWSTGNTNVVLLGL